MIDNRLISRNTPIPPVVIPAVKSGFDKFCCRSCGYGLASGDHKRRLLYTTDHDSFEPHWEYCPNCGQAILPASYAGCCGWEKEEADKKYVEILERHRETLKDNRLYQKADLHELIQRVTDTDIDGATKQIVINLIYQVADIGVDDASEILNMASMGISDICHAMERRNSDDEAEEED